MQRLLSATTTSLTQLVLYTCCPTPHTHNPRTVPTRYSESHRAGLAVTTLEPHGAARAVITH